MSCELFSDLNLSKHVSKDDAKIIIEYIDIVVTGKIPKSILVFCDTSSDSPNKLVKNVIEKFKILNINVINFDLLKDPIDPKFRDWYEYAMQLTTNLVKEKFSIDKDFCGNMMCECLAVYSAEFPIPSEEQVKIIKYIN